ncbi:MAG: 4Fe-4S binding protein [Anaerolineae bacterium]|nr:4Fe-4S binding protein [Anaerolineae bacterium]
MNRLGNWLLKRRAVVHAISALTLNSYVTQNVTKGIPCAALNCHACPVDIRIYENPASAMCIRCMACVSVCPAECISVASRGWTVETDQLAQREQTSTSANT